MAKEEVQIVFRGTEEYRQSLQKEALLRNIKVQQLITEALDQYLDKPAIVRKGTTQDDKLIGLLSRVLPGISPKDRQTLTAILEVFERTQQRQNQNDEPRTHRPPPDHPGGSQLASVTQDGGSGLERASKSARERFADAPC
jgi:hypothetical protein